MISVFFSSDRFWSSKVFTWDTCLGRVRCGHPPQAGKNSFTEALRQVFTELAPQCVCGGEGGQSCSLTHLSGNSAWESSEPCAVFRAFGSCPFFPPNFSCFTLCLKFRSKKSNGEMLEVGLDKEGPFLAQNGNFQILTLIEVLLTLCVWVFCLYVCAPCAKALVLLELELKMGVNCRVGFGNQSPILCKSSKCC